MSYDAMGIRSKTKYYFKQTRRRRQREEQEEQNDIRSLSHRADLGSDYTLPENYFFACELFIWIRIHHNQHHYIRRKTTPPG